MKYSSFTLAVAAFLCFSGQTASAYCFDPTFYAEPPTPPGAYSKPTVPYCLSDYAWSNEHTCESWEISSYFNDVEAYQSKLDAYVDELSTYVDEVANNVASAIDYAACEKSAVANQHK